jgi:hypothetical protein
MYTAEDTASLKVLQGSRRSVWATQHVKTCDHRQPTFSTCMVGRTQPVAQPPYCLASLSIGRATKRDEKCGLLRGSGPWGRCTSTPLRNAGQQAKRIQHEITDTHTISNGQFCAQNNSYLRFVSSRASYPPDTAAQVQLYRFK